LVEASLTWFEADQADAPELEARCIAGYLAGLKAVGWEGDALDVRFGYVASLVLRCALGAVGPIVTIMRNQSLHSWIEHAFGRPLEAVVENLGKTMAFLEPRIDTARRRPTNDQVSHNASHSDQRDRSCLRRDGQPRRPGAPHAERVTGLAPS
jgi:hypothetical protein